MRLRPTVTLFAFLSATSSLGAMAADRPPPATQAPPERPKTVAPLGSQLAVPAVPNQRPGAAAAPNVAPAPAGAQTPPPTLRPGETLLNFQSADIQAVVKTISQITGRNFLVDPRVKGQVTIISAKPVSAGVAYQVFLAALKAQGFTAVDGVGNLVKIVPSAEAKHNAFVTPEDGPRASEALVTHVAVLQHASATQMVPLLRPLMAPTSQLSAFDPANTLIITDYADNVRRMLQIIEKIDQPLSADVTIVPLQHASALDMADLITRLSTTAAPGAAIPGAVPGSGGDRFSIVPDLRTNSLLIRTDNPGRLNQLRALIARLDVPAVTGGNTRVIYLKNADAVKLAEVLRGLLAAEARALTAAASASATAAVARPSAAAKAVEASLIQADEATNALIINATDAVYNNLRAVIEKLDVRRAQVFVEALIVEISSDKASELGFQWAAVGKQGAGGVAGLTNFPLGGTPLAAAAVNPAGVLANAGGLSVAFLGPEITLPNGTRTRGLGGLARLLEENSYANILSTPNLMTLDNAEAKIIVGQNVPFVTGSFAQAAGAAGAAVNPFQTIERKDVGLTLKVKPQISDGGAIKLDIYQEVSSVARATTGASDLVTNKRSLETKVIIDDGHTVVLGGLIEDNTTDSEQAVPFLGRLPLLGWLFRYREKTGRKTNLMVFLRPVIVRSVHEGYNVTVDRYDYLRALDKNPSAERATTLNRLAPKAPPPKTDDSKKEVPADSLKPKDNGPGDTPTVTPLEPGSP
jgi:general secretion pathway protein D